MNNVRTKWMSLLFGISITLFISNFSFTQNDSMKLVYNSVVSIAIGDLNKDNLADSVVVTQDTINDLAPYRLEIFFTQKDGTKTKNIQTDKAISPQYINGRDWGHSLTSFSQISIQKGVLWIEIELWRGHYEHKFRYQNGGFELIGYSYGESDGISKITTIDYNLSTGKRIEKIESYGQEIEEYEPTSIIEKIIKLNPLPNLFSFEPNTNEFY